MSSEKLIRWGGIAAILGGILWIGVAAVMASRPPGGWPEGPTRGIHDLRPFWLISFLLIGAGLVATHARHVGRSGRLGLISLVIGLVGVALWGISLALHITRGPLWQSDEDTIFFFFMLPGFLALIQTR